MSQKGQRVYFPGLNALRFFAAFAVLIHHLERVKKDFLFKGIKGFEHDLLGSVSVTFFFVLSGFLITYLLLVELENSGTISLRKFYMRRILRIWPLYYLVVILGFFVLPYLHFLDNPRLSPYVFDGFSMKFAMFATLFPNVAHYFFNPMPHILQAWSIGVEEQFYIFWPLVILLFKARPKSMWTVIIIYSLLKLGLTLYVETGDRGYYPIRVWRVLNYARFHIMAFGGLGAYWLYHKKGAVLGFVYHKWTQYTSWILLVALVLLGFEIPHLTHEFYAILFLIIILNLSSNVESILRLERPWLNYLGKISYGIYMYHLLCIAISMALLRSIGFMKGEEMILLEHFLLFLLSTIFTIAISSLSYEYYEKIFLRLKNRLAIVKSGK